MTSKRRRSVTSARPGVFALALACACASTVSAQATTFEEKLQEIMDRPEYRHAMFGIEFYSLDTNKPVFTLNADKFFTPASTTKLLTEGSALQLLGADYRFHTRVYRTGPIGADSALKGDLVLVASGDPNLSARVQNDGTLAFEDEDHSYDGSADTKAVPGDPLLVLGRIAQQVSARGIRRIDGRVLVDNTLFPEGQRELGTEVVISPVSLNDNLVDLFIAPGASVGAPVSVRVSPETGYVRFINQATTSSAGTPPHIRWSSDVALADGSRAVTITGSFPAATSAWLFSYAVPEPRRFAETALVEELRRHGVDAHMEPAGKKTDFKLLAPAYTEANVVAEHVSPPLSEEVKVTLKVSQNLHASMTPYILGALVGGKTDSIEQAGFDLEREFLEKAGLDLSGAAQGDGAGGAQSAFFTPDFVVKYLAYMARQEDFAVFKRALPVLGQDGTLFKIQVNSVAAGKVFAKTGTFSAQDRLNRRPLLTGKGLAGYLTTPGGQRLAFALYANRVPLPNIPEATAIVGQALGEIAGAAYIYLDEHINKSAAGH
jgi:PBP4 family serine-type D-alanyl-D-alanine carboxypeptidase